MNPSTKERIKGILIIPIGLALVLIPFSMFIGWNLITLLVFWFIVVPLLTIYLPHFVSRNRRHTHESIIGLCLFYTLMVFMIYSHSKSDFFEIMMVSWAVNSIVVLAVTRLKRKPKWQIH